MQRISIGSRSTERNWNKAKKAYQHFRDFFSETR